MRIRWRGLELPNRVVSDRSTLTDTYGKFVAEPFERGFGVTVGNSLRRILLSSLEGSAVTRVKIQGVQHEITTIPGVVEDVTDIILNIKSLVVKNVSEQTKTIRIDRHEKGVIKAAGTDYLEINSAVLVNHGVVETWGGTDPFHGAFLDIGTHYELLGTGFASLFQRGVNLDNSDGTIIAEGQGSSVNFLGTIVHGGTLQSMNGGSLWFLKSGLSAAGLFEVRKVLAKCGLLVARQRLRIP